jgi:hypothetical protein
MIYNFKTVYVNSSVVGSIKERCLFFIRMLSKLDCMYVNVVFVRMYENFSK